MNDLPATITDPASGMPAASTPDATGREGADSQSAAPTHPKELSPSALVDAWLAGENGQTPQAEKTLPGAPGTEANEDAETGRPGDAETEADDEDPDKTNPAEHGDPPSGQLDHLIEAILKESGPDGQLNKDSAVYKRASKLLGQPAKLNTRIKDLETKLKDVNGPPVFLTQNENDPLSSVSSMDQLHQTVRNAEYWEAWCEDHREGGLTNPNDHSSHLDAEAVKSHLRLARAILRSAPGRADWVQRMGDTRDSLLASNPELFEEESPELQECLQLIQEGRISTYHPDYLRDALDLMEGRRARQEREQGIKTVKLDPKEAMKRASHQQQNGFNPRPGPSGGSVINKSPATRPASAGADLVAAKKAAAAGDFRAKSALIDAFINQD